MFRGLEWPRRTFAALVLLTMLVAPVVVLGLVMGASLLKALAYSLAFLGVGGAVMFLWKQVRARTPIGRWLAEHEEENRHHLQDELRRWRAVQLQDHVPSSFDLSDPAHVALLDGIRSAYGNHLADGLGGYDGCMFRPASELPYAKGDIETALTALLDFVEGRRESRLLDAAIRQPGVAENIRTSLVLLDDFLDIPPDQLPTEPKANAREGFRLREEER